MKCKGWWMAVMFVFSSCEKTINLQVNNQSSKLVVDAVIENGSLPIVVLSTSLNYFSAITPAQLSASFVHNAKVIITDGINSNELTEQQYMDSNGTQLYFYALASSTIPTAIIGQFNHQYQLSIQTSDGIAYTSTTTIPLLSKTCDSLWWKTAPQNPDTNRVVLMGRFTDPPGYGNYIRYFTKTNNESFYPGINSVFDDEFVDGTTYDVLIDKSYSRNNPIKFNDDDYGFFHRGDTASLKFCNIDKATYDFWRTWEFNFQSNGNPFSSPTKVIGNVSNGALGAFCGYAVQYKTLIIPK